MDPTIANVGSSGGMGQPKRADQVTTPPQQADELRVVPNGASTPTQALGDSSVTPQTAGVPLAKLPTVPAAAPVVLTEDSPLVAADEEVMEKEWVEKAKKIVAQTKDDPYSQEKQVSKLQADYIKKRYGKDIKLTSD